MPRPALGKRPHRLRFVLFRHDRDARTGWVSYGRAMEQHGHGHGHGHGQKQDHDQEAWGDADLAVMLDLDAEVLRDQLHKVTGEIAAVAGERVPRRVLDLGAGTGSGTFALLRRFPAAHVTAVDVSPVMLQRLRAAVGELGAQVEILAADLDAGWPALDTTVDGGVGDALDGVSEGAALDLVWAAASLHHVADPDRVLRDVAAALRPGGLLTLLEMDSFPRFLPDAVGDGFEARVHAALRGVQVEVVPHFGTDWGPRLAAAGFTVEVAREVTLDLPAPSRPLPEASGRYAQVFLRRVRTGLTGLAEADVAPSDLLQFDVLLADDGPDSLLHRDDLVVRATRSLWIARTGSTVG
ncbi:MAG: class I SAM-dependent methyltransferase [Janthinobacterium lividum]